MVIYWSPAGTRPRYEVSISHSPPSLSAMLKHLWRKFIVRPPRRVVDEFANAYPRCGLVLREAANVPWVLMAIIIQAATRKTFSEVETIFLHIPKTGGTSVKSILEESYGISLLKISSARDIVSALLSSTTPKAIILNHVFPQILSATRVLSLDNFEGNFFTIVRNPRERFESGFIYGNLRSFWPRSWGREEILGRLASPMQKPGFSKARGVFFLRPQSDFLAFQGVERLCVHKLEIVQSQGLVLLGRKNSLPTLNKGNYGASEETSETVRCLIGRVFEDDFNALGYELDSGPERQIKPC